MTGKPQITIDEQKELGDWYTRFLQIYPNCNKTEAGRIRLYALRPDRDERGKIYEWVLRDNQLRRQHKNKFYRVLPNLKDFFLDKLWFDVLEKERELLDLPEKVKQVHLCACGQKADLRLGEDLWVCCRCYERRYET